MEKETAIKLLTILDRFVDNNPSMFDYDTGKEEFDYNHFSVAIDMGIEALKEDAKETSIILCEESKCVHNCDGECCLNRISLEFIFANERAQCANRQLKKEV